MAYIPGTSGKDNLVGTAGDDTLEAFAGNDTLNGGLGADLMIGGKGDDLYYVDNTGDVVTEALNEGVDKVVSSINYTLLANVENLTISGAAVSGTGNNLANMLTGNGGANILSGLGGNDKLDGKAGADTMIGGNGDDSYMVDDAGDVVTELSGAGSGVDTVSTSYNGYTLTENVEKLILLAGVISGSGNNGDNTLTGNELANILNGGEGNDRLDGKAGADTMIGGKGDDSYNVGSALDVVIEALNEGTDEVFSSVTFTLGANVENLTMTGSFMGDGTGNDLNNRINGSTGANILKGGLGNDTLNGRGGADFLYGGQGDDTYIITVTGATVVEVDGEGANDLVNSYIDYTLDANIENLHLQRNSNLNGTGNDLGNNLKGNSGENVLIGLGGNDILNGQEGADTLTGGEGDDTYKYNDVKDGGDIITDFSQSGVNGADVIDVSGIDANSGSGGNQAFVFGGTTPTANGVSFIEVGGNTMLTFDTDGVTGTVEMAIILIGAGLGLTAADFIL